jgi:sugar lactone lactonase YvrE
MAGGWIISTVVGTGFKGYSGDGGLAIDAQLDNPFDITFDVVGNMYFSDTYNHVIRRVARHTGVITTVAGNGTEGFGGDGGTGVKGMLNQPYGVVIDRENRIFFADRLNRRVRMIHANGIITTLAGNGTNAFSGDGGSAASASLREPNGLALSLDHAKLYITDVADHRVRCVDIKSGVITTVAGTGEARHDGDGGPATAASIFGARAVAVGPDGALYVMERQGSTIRVIRDGIITTIAGTGARGYAGDGGPARDAVFDAPKEMCVDKEANIYVVDTENHAIRRIDATTGIVETIAGGRLSPTGDGGPAERAGLARPHGVAIGPDGALYIGDSENHRVRRVARAA